MRAIAAIDACIRRMHPRRNCADKHRTAKLGEESDYFCRQTLRMLAENPQVIPPNLDLADATADLDARDALRPRLMRLTRLLERGNDTDFALGSDAMAAAAPRLPPAEVRQRPRGPGPAEA